MEKNHLIIYIITGISITVLITIFVLYLSVIERKKYLIQQNRLEMLVAEKQRDVLKAVIRTEEKERKRIARDLHDSVGACLSMIKLDLSQQNQALGAGKTNPRLSDTIHRLDQAVSSIRAACFRLYPAHLAKYGLIAVMEQSLLNWHEAGGINAKFTSDVKEEGLGGTNELKLNLFRVFEEVVNNIVKHGRCSEIAVTVHEQPAGTCSVNILHDGSPFSDTEANSRLHNGIGLSSIRSRLDLIGGRINYQSEDKLQAVVIRVPLGNAEDKNSNS